MICVFVIFIKNLSKIFSTLNFFFFKKNFKNKKNLNNLFFKRSINLKVSYQFNTNTLLELLLIPKTAAVATMRRRIGKWKQITIHISQWVSSPYCTPSHRPILKLSITISLVRFFQILLSMVVSSGLYHEFDPKLKQTENCRDWKRGRSLRWKKKTKKRKKNAINAEVRV